MTNGNDLVTGGEQVETKQMPEDPIFTYDVKTPTGLTKREYFAAMALEGMLGGSDIYLEGIVAKGLSTHQAAVLHADALIEALNKEK